MFAEIIYLSNERLEKERETERQRDDKCTKKILTETWQFNICEMFHSIPIYTRLLSKKVEKQFASLNSNTIKFSETNNTS